ncbi:hypothetical protein D9M71_785250 [compost metagenome]
MAPRLIKFPLTPKAFIKITANNIANGITEATINPARRFPKNKIKTKITINAPSNKFLATVLMELSTSFPRSIKASATTPSGRLLLI